MNSYKYIINPNTGRRINVLSKTGETIINNYIDQLGGGVCGFDEKTKRCNRKSVGNKEYLCEMGDKGSCRKKKTLDSNVFVSSQVPSSKIKTQVISSTIEDEFASAREHVPPASRNKFGLEQKKDVVLERLNAQITAIEEGTPWQWFFENEGRERVTGYSVKGLNREIPDIIDSDMKTDIDLEYNRLKEHYDRTINHLLQTFKNCFMDPDDLFGDWEFEIDAIILEMETANNDIEIYVTTHYPSYLGSRVIVDENDIRRQIDAIVKMGIRKYVTYIRERNASSPDDFDDFPNMLKDNLDILAAFNKNKLPNDFKGCIEITKHNSVPSKYTKYTKRNSPPYHANECKEGMKMVGNDGNMYTVSKPDKNGVKRWRKLTRSGAYGNLIKTPTV